MKSNGILLIQPISDVYLQKLIDIVTNVVISQRRIQNFKVCAVNIFKNQAWSFRMLISNNIKQLDNIWPTAKVLKYLNLSSYLRKKDHKIQETTSIIQTNQTQNIENQFTFFFLTGLRILIIHLSLLFTFIPSKTSLYFPRPTFLTTS